MFTDELTIMNHPNGRESVKRSKESDQVMQGKNLSISEKQSLCKVNLFGFITYEGPCEFFLDKLPKAKKEI